MNPVSTYAPGLMSVNDFSQTLPTVNSTAPANPQTAQPTHSGGGIFGAISHLLPTIGAIGGGILGGAADVASLGAAAPLINPITGAALGGALGKAGENATEDKNLLSGDLGAAAEGAIGQGTGMIAGKALGAGAEMLGNRGTELAKTAEAGDNAAQNLENTKTLNAIYGKSSGDVGRASDMAQQAGIDMTNPEAVKTAGQQILSNAGDALDNAVGTTRIPISGVIDESGNKVAPSIDDLIHSSLTNTNELTGDKLGASRSLVMGGLGPDQTDEDLLRNGYTRFLSSSAKNGTATPATNYLKEANQLLSGVNHGSTADAHDLLDAQRLVGDKAQAMAQAAAKPSANEVTQAQAATWKDLNNKLQNMIFSHPDISDAVKNMAGNNSAEDFGGNQPLADLFNSRVTAAQSGKDLNGLMHDAYNLRDVGNDGVAELSDPSSTGNLKLASMAAAEKGTGDPTLLDKAHDVHSSNGLVGTTLAVGKHVANSPGLMNTVARIGKLGSKLAPAAAITATTAGNMGADPTGLETNTADNSTIGSAMNDQNVLAQLYQNLLDQYNAGGNVGPNAGSLNTELGSLAPQVQKQNLASGALNSLESAYNNAGGAQGTSGILSRISGLFPGTAANTYERQQQAAAAALGNALGISPAQAAGYLPQLMQNPNSAGINQGILGQLQGQLSY